MPTCINCLNQNICKVSATAAEITPYLKAGQYRTLFEMLADNCRNFKQEPTNANP